MKSTCIATLVACTLATVFARRNVVSHVEIGTSQAEVADEVALEVIHHANMHGGKHGPNSGHSLFTLALSGGSLPAIVAQGLKPRVDEVENWDSWHIFFADERMVALDHEDSNYRLCKEVLLDHLPLKEDQIHVIDPTLSPTEAAAAYEKEIMALLAKDSSHTPDGNAANHRPPTPAFSMILLGMGPDGHTASLFPEHPLLEEANLMVASITDAPKPPPSRITFTLPLINAARCVAFVCTGEAKADALSHVLSTTNSNVEGSRLPAALVKPTDGVTRWFVDKEAAKIWDTRNKNEL